MTLFSRRVMGRVEFTYATDPDGSFVCAEWFQPTGYNGMPSRLIGPYMRSPFAAVRALLEGMRPETFLCGVDAKVIAEMQKPIGGVP